jgi:hypothetical protein
VEENRITILPDERFSAVRSALLERLTSIAANITAENIGSLFDGTMRSVIDFGFKETGASEGTIWILEPPISALVPCFNSGPNANSIVGQFKQPLNAGLISMVFATQQPFLENEVFANKSQDKSLDSALRLQTYAMIAVPLYFLEDCRGVISCVQLKVPGSAEPDPPGFDEGGKARLSHTSTVFGRLLDYRLLRATMGLS